MHNINNYGGYFDFLRTLGIHDIPTTYGKLELGGTLIPNETKLIFSAEMRDLKKLKLDLKKLFDNSKITVKYKSLYEEEFIVSNE